MKYISTRGQIEPVDFCRAVMMGLADDGGLVIPRDIPDISDRMDNLRGLSYADLACEIIGLFATDIPAGDLRGLIEKSYDANSYGGDIAPVRQVGDIFILELFNGPTLAFKDVALQLLGNLFEYILRASGGRLNILGATSGDTGSAAIYGVRGRAGIDIFVMHPHGRVSPIQERQMTSITDENVHNIAITGSFDDCQRIMKTIAGDLDFKRKYSLGAVNSVNWARVLAQIVYYFSAAFDVQKRTGAKSVRFSVPTGNFGDVLAGWYAMKMGCPISKLILATNENDILARFFTSGVYSIGDVHRTLAPSMDIQIASNFERYLYYKLGSDGQKLRETMEQFSQSGSLSVPVAEDGYVDEDFLARAATMEDVLATISQFYEKFDYILDPHTACGVSVASKVIGLADEQDKDSDDTSPIISLATAHPAKFPDAIAQATGKTGIAKHPKIDALADMPTKCTVIPCDVEKVKQFIVDKIG